MAHQERLADKPQRAVIGVVILAALMVMSVNAQAADLSTDEAFCSSITEPHTHQVCLDTIAARAHKDYQKSPAIGGYHLLALIDLKAEIVGLKGTRVTVNGLLSPTSLETATLGNSVHDSSAVPLSTTSLPRDQRRTLFETCASQCNAEVSGTVTIGPTGLVLAVEKAVFR